MLLINLKWSHIVLPVLSNKPWNRHQGDSITDMLKELNWPSLQDHRKHARFILMYKIASHLLIVPG